ncbi:MAG: hypothetical protein K6G80_06170 [Treponema sp.]|nr:hypothetical protein [Treponema sp.]
MAYFGLLIAVVIIGLALSLFNKWWKLSSNDSSPESQLRTQKGEDGKIEFVRCPVCNTPLAKNENLSSVVYHPMNVPDQRMTIRGCPHCYPVAAPSIRRSCPVCGREVAADGYLIARLFNKPGKKHVIVAGCARCCVKNS